MNTNKHIINQRIRALLASAALVACFGTASAQLQWDPGITAGVTLGGSTSGESTEWKTSGSNIWWDGANNVAWTNGNDATFGGTAGTVNLGSAVSAGTLDFDTAGYVIDLRDYNGGVATNAPAHNLTLTGLSGQAATIRNSSDGTPVVSTLTLSMAADTVWGGNLGSGSDRMNITVNGGNSLTVNQVTRGGGFGQTTLRIAGADTKLALSGTGSTYWGNLLVVESGGTFDLGNNGNFAIRYGFTDSTSTITATGTARITDGWGGSDSTFNGFLTGTLEVGQSAGDTMTISNDGNTYSGGTFLSSGTINADANNALGTGLVSMSNSSGTSTLRFRSEAPVIGSLESSNAGSKSVVLGNTGTDTTLSIGGLNTDTTFGGVISQFSGQTGSLTKVGDGTLTLGGANTYTGATTINQGTLLLASTGSVASTTLGFGITDTTNGTLQVENAAFAFTGTLDLILAPVTASVGSWNLFTGTQFGLGDLDLTGISSDIAGLSFSETGGIWSGTADGRTWNFAEDSGVLSVIPEPSTLMLVGLFGLAVVALRRRKTC